MTAPSASPFPGMDPFLEDPSLWPDFQRGMILSIQEVLPPVLEGRYEAVNGQRTYRAEAPEGAAEHREDFLEIRLRSDDRLITLIEVVSPANKTKATGREAYLSTRRSARERKPNLAEIDLVLQGRPLLDYSREGLPDWDYAVTVTRAAQPERYEIYTATLPKRLPRFRLPLGDNERDVVLDLPAIFTRCYAEGDFAARIDYASDPPAPLEEADARWLEELLAEKGFRGRPPSGGEIAVAAYALWEREGRPHGRDKEFWYRARTELRRQRRRTETP